MNYITDISNKIQLTQKLITELEDAYALNPTDKSILFSLESVNIKLANLSKKFQEAAKYDHRNICSYRLFNENLKNFSISSIGSLLTEFQNLFTTIFGSIQNKDLKKLQLTLKKTPN